MPMPDPSPHQARQFLFLQGPISPFFPDVAQGLADLGHGVHRINLCLGDRLFWRNPSGAPPALDYRDGPLRWPGFIAGFLEARGITDIILLGEQRQYHRAAIEAAAARGIPVIVTDFGYFRPDWITLERDGLGGGSLFPRDPGAIRWLARGLPPAELKPRLGDSFLRQAAWDVTYNLATRLRWPFPQYRDHLIHHPLLTYAGIGLRLLRRRAEQREGRQALERLRGRPFWVFAMQMEADFSIRAYSPFDDMTQPIEETLRSFARAAPAEGHLLVKIHPLDPCLRHWPRRIGAMATRAGLAGRVHVVRHGPLEAMIAASRGVVTVNSTVGMNAVMGRRPVKALGQAVWDVPGLAHQGALDRFWTDPPALDEALREDFLAALQAETQLRGVFYAPEGRRIAVAETVRRLHEGRVGVRAVPLREAA